MTKPPFRLVIEVPDLKTPVLPQTAELLCYWQSKCAPGQIPARKDIEPTEIPRLIPNLAILMPIDEGADWEVRLMGTGVTRRFAHDPTGRGLSSEFDFESAATLGAVYRSVAKTGQPSIMHVRYVAENSDHILAEQLSMPVIGTDGAAIWILLGIFYFN